MAIISKREREMVDPFCMGPALLHIGDSTSHAPGPFRDALLKALDSRSRAALALTCKPARHWLWRDWPAAALHLTVRPSGADQPSTALLRRLHAAREDTSVRGEKCLELTLQQQGNAPQSDSYWQAVVTGLGQSCSDVTLSLHLQNITPSLLTLAGRAFPGLTSLSLGSLTCIESKVELPPQAALPALRHLTIRHASLAAVFCSVGPYLQQLTSLTIEKQPEAQMQSGHWATVLHGRSRAATPSHTLVRLSVPCTLDPLLVKLLQQHTPALRRLAVAAVSRPENAEGVAPVWSWRTLRLDEHVSHVYFLHWLPLPSEGKLEIEWSQNSAKLVIALPLRDTVASTMARLALTGCGKIQLTPRSPFNQVDHLRAALPHIAHLQSPDIELEVCWAYLSPDLVALLHEFVAAGWNKLSLPMAVWPAEQPLAPLAAPLPPLKTLSFSIEYIRDALLADIRQCVSSVEVLGVCQCALEASVPAGGSLPWHTVKLASETDIAVLLQQAERMACCWEVKELCIKLTPEQVHSGEYMRLAEQLSRVRIASVHRLKIHNTATDSADEPRLLAASVAIARALPCPAQTLRLHRFTAAAAVISELRGLPAWHATLELHLWLSDKPGTASCERAAVHIPRTYHTWVTERLSGRSIPPEQLTSLFSHTLADRTEAEPLTIKVLGWDQDRVAALMAQMEEDGSYPYVTVLGW